MICTRKPQRDLLMFNFMFDKAQNVEQLEAMWSVFSITLKHSLRFVGARVGSAFFVVACSGKYGVTFEGLTLDV